MERQDSNTKDSNTKDNNTKDRKTAPALNPEFVSFISGIAKFIDGIDRGELKALLPGHKETSPEQGG